MFPPQGNPTQPFNKVNKFCFVLDVTKAVAYNLSIIAWRWSTPETRKDIDVQELFLLPSTGQLENCMGHLSIKYAILASLLQSN